VGLSAPVSERFTVLPGGVLPSAERRNFKPLWISGLMRDTHLDGTCVAAFGGDCGPSMGLFFAFRPMLKSKLLFLAGVLALSVPLRATVITYNSLANWTTALGGGTPSLIDFAGTVPPNGVAGSDGLTYGGGPNGQWTSSLVNSGVTFSSTGYVFYVSQANATDSAFHTSPYLDWQDPGFGTLTIAFPSAVTAASFSIGGYNGGGTALVNVNGTNYSVTMPNSSYGFFGFTSTTGISSLTVTGTNNYATLDNLRYLTSASVPDASSTLVLMILGCGLAAASHVRLRRK
jgi:hypothetical protein